MLWMCSCVHECVCVSIFFFVWCRPHLRLGTPFRLNSVQMFLSCRSFFFIYPFRRSTFFLYFQFLPYFLLGEPSIKKFEMSCENKRRMGTGQRKRKRKNIKQKKKNLLSLNRGWLSSVKKVNGCTKMWKHWRWRWRFCWLWRMRLMMLVSR